MLKFRLLVLVLVAMIAAVQYRLWVSDDGIVAVKRLEAKVDAQSAENARLRSRNDRLEAEVRDLKAGLEAVEERARRELGMVAEDETFYQFVLPPGAPPSGDSNVSSVQAPASGAGSNEQAATAH